MATIEDKEQKHKQVRAKIAALKKQMEIEEAVYKATLTSVEQDSGYKYYSGCVEKNEVKRASERNFYDMKIKSLEAKAEAVIEELEAKIQHWERKKDAVRAALEIAIEKEHTGKKAADEKIDALILTQQKEMERIRGKFEDATPCTQSYRKATAALAVAEREEKEMQDEVVKLYGEMQRVLGARQKRESDALLRKMEEEKRRENAKRMEEIVLQKQREEMASAERAKERDRMSKAAAAAKP